MTEKGLERVQIQQPPRTGRRHGYGGWPYLVRGVQRLHTEELARMMGEVSGTAGELL